MDKAIPKEIESLLEYRANADGTRKVKRVMPLRPCEACGKPIDEQRTVNIYVSLESSVNHSHKKYKCTTCGVYMDPVTGEFTAEYNDVADHFRKQKRKKR